MNNKDETKWSESQHQAQFFKFCGLAEHWGFDAAAAYLETGVKPKFLKPIPELRWIHAIPNGGARGDNAQARAIRGAQLKAEGVKRGIPDIFWPYSHLYDGFKGLYIELKKFGGNPSVEQLEFRQYVLQEGYLHEFCIGWREAAQTVEHYWVNSL